MGKHCRVGSCHNVSLRLVTKIGTAGSRIHFKVIGTADPRRRTYSIERGKAVGTGLVLTKSVPSHHSNILICHSLHSIRPAPESLTPLKGLYASPPTNLSWSTLTIVLCGDAGTLYVIVTDRAGLGRRSLWYHKVRQSLEK
jgi:hypothetical protein